MDHHAVAAVSLTGICLDVLGGLYLAYDLLGGQHGPLRLLTRIVTYSIVYVTILVSSRKRSEEPTSELQSRLHLVCRRLLEKKHNILKPAPFRIAWPSCERTKSTKRRAEPTYPAVARVGIGEPAHTFCLSAIARPSTFTLAR